VNERTLRQIIDNSVRTFSHFARSFLQKGYITHSGLDDLIQAIRVGAWVAATTHDPSKGSLEGRIYARVHSAVRREALRSASMDRGLKSTTLENDIRAHQSLAKLKDRKVLSLDTPVDGADKSSATCLLDLIPSTLTDPLTTLLESAARESLRRALNEVSEADRALLLHYVNGGMDDDLARRDQISRQAVNVRKKNAIKRVQRVMARLEEGAV
jgi:RNA polymerase sigma factor (sigma-70 family)